MRDETLIEKEFNYKGFYCVIYFRHLGYRCGYVGLGKDYECINADDINCHGGITYDYKCLPDGSQQGIRWIGFDCAHYGDGVDAERAKELYENNRYIMSQIKSLERIGYYGIYEKHPVRSLEFCEEQCKGIVEQVLEVR